MEILPRLPRERGRRRPGSARAEAEDRRGPDAAARGERKHRQALGQRVRQFAPRHAGHRPRRVQRSALDREDRRPRRARVARLPGGAERGRHLRRVDRARPRPVGAGARRAAGGRGDEPRWRRCAAPSRDSRATRARKRSRGGLPTGRPNGGAPRRSPGRGRPGGGGGGAPSRGRAPAHGAPHREPRRPAVDASRCPWSATGAAWQPTCLPDDDHAGRRVAWCAADAVHRHAADDTVIATILTTAHSLAVSSPKVVRPAAARLGRRTARPGHPRAGVARRHSGRIASGRPRRIRLTTRAT